MNVMRFFYVIITFILLFVITSCIEDPDYKEGVFPSTPVNFEDINSEYDDYNSAVPSNLYGEFPYLFSSNRNSQGTNYDLVYYNVSFYFNDSQEKVYFNAREHEGNYFEEILSEINTSSNELGPYLTYTLDYLNDLLFYATDSSGSLDIHYTYFTIEENDWQTPSALSKINTEYNEAYPTFNRSRDEFYFCSDENGNYDFYKVGLASTNVIDWFSTEEAPQKIACEILNSDSDDKCPYINRNLMVFASDREGGFGGYDLYYSRYINGSWSAPINFGESINTEHDEFRPVALYANNYVNDVMIFSSNRPGGEGGFDLYYVGIQKMIL